MSNYIVNNDTVDVLSENCITILKNLPAKTDISPEPINLFTTNPLRIAKWLKGSNDDYEWKHIVFGPNDLIENGIDRLVYKVEKENILLECVQATSVDNNIADIFNMNNNYRNAF